MAFGSKPPEDATPQPAQPEPEPAPAPAAPAEPEEPEPEPEPEPTTAEIIAKTAKETATAVADALKPAAPAPAPTTQTQSDSRLELIPEDEEDLKVIKFLEATDPKWRGKAEQFTSYLKKYYDYQDKWAEGHPGETFNPDDAEHEHWMAGNDPGIDARELDRGRIEMIAEERSEQKLAPIREEIRTNRNRKLLEESTPKVVKVLENRLVDFVEKASPELAELLGPKGKRAITPEAETKMEDADPIAKEILMRTAEYVAPLIAELERSAVVDENNMSVSPLNPSANPAHRIIDGYRRTAERDMAEAGPEAQVFPDGKRFVTVEDLQRRERACRTQSEREALHRNFRSFTVDEIQDIIVDDASKRARELIENTDKIAKKKYGRGTAGTQSKPSTEPATTSAPRPGSNKPNSPSVSSQNNTVTTPNSASTPSKTYGEQAVALHFK